MRKTYITLAAVILCVGYGILGWDIVTHSAEPTAADSQFAGACGADPQNPNACCVAYNESLAAAKRDWQANLQQLINQEKAASEMVDDGYESLRTYNCWVEYICRSVEYSGHAPVESALGTGLQSRHLGVVPGCQKPENLKMESEYNNYTKAFKKIPIVGVTADVIGKAFLDNKIAYFPQCQTDGKHNNANPDINKAKENYDGCKRTMELNFGCPAGIDAALCADTSNAFVTLETVLKKKQGDQKAAALEKKLSTIIPKLQSMETHVNYLHNFLKQLNDRFSCYAGKCS